MDAEQKELLGNYIHLAVDKLTKKELLDMYFTKLYENRQWYFSSSKNPIPFDELTGIELQNIKEELLKLTSICPTPGLYKMLGLVVDTLEKDYTLINPFDNFNK